MANDYSTPTLVMNIKRQYFAAILAQPPRKVIEYRKMSKYWERRLERVGPAPFDLRLLNGMTPPVPEATVRVTKVVWNWFKRTLEFHLGEVIEVKNWDRKNECPIK